MKEEVKEEVKEEEEHLNFVWGGRERREEKKVIPLCDNLERRAQIHSLTEADFMEISALAAALGPFSSITELAPTAIVGERGGEGEGRRS